MGASELSKARLERMHDVMAGYVDRGQVPGLVALVSRAGELRVDALGSLAVGGQSRVQRDTIFRIASMTKPVTAAAAMILVEECRLRLDEPVDRLLPELADRKVIKRFEGALDDTVPAKRSITVRDLLTFRMGFGIVVAPPDPCPILKAASDLRIGLGPPSPRSMPAPDEWIRRLGSLPLMHQPGKKWMYGTGSDVLGVLIARASGQPFEAFYHCARSTHLPHGFWHHGRSARSLPDPEGRQRPPHRFGAAKSCEYARSRRVDQAPGKSAPHAPAWQKVDV